MYKMTDRNVQTQMISFWTNNVMLKIRWYILNVINAKSTTSKNYSHFHAAKNDIMQLLKLEMNIAEQLNRLKFSTFEELMLT